MGDPFELLITERPPPGWDEWLASAGSEGGFAQSSTWASMAVAGRRARCWFLQVLAGRAQVGGALLTLDAGIGPFRRLPGVPGTLLCLDGPVVPAQQVDVLRPLLDGLERVRRTAGSASGVIVPPPGTTLTDALVTLLGSTWDASARATAVVDLDRPLDEVWKGTAKTVRRNVRRCREAGVIVHEIASLDEFRTQFVDPFERRIGAPRQWRPVRQDVMWELGAGRTHRFFVAELDGVPLATLGTHRWEGVATEIASARTPEGAASGFQVQDLLHWSVIEAHHHHGDRAFDLAGFEPDGPGAKDDGIRRFKTKWGGAIVPTTRFSRPAGAPVARAIGRARTVLAARATSKKPGAPEAV